MTYFERVLKYALGIIYLHVKENSKSWSLKQDTGLFISLVNQIWCLVVQGWLDCL